MNILEQIAEETRERVKAKKKVKSLEALQEEAEALFKGSFPFKSALSQDGLSFICECKKASPSKGLIAPDFPYLKIAQTYARAGAAAISVLTEPEHFLGKDEYLKEIAKAVKVPCLRKDFVVDSYMIYEAKVLGAAAILLICSILTDKELKEYLSLAKALGLDAVVEAHDRKEVERALALKAEIIGVNNRNLKDFSVDTKNSAELRRLIPSDVIFISESGIKTKEDVKAIKDMGADAVLIGEALMRSGNIEETLKDFRNA